MAIGLNLGVSLSAVVALASCAAPRACAGGVFRDTSRSGTVDPPAGRTIRRLRRVEVDFGRLFRGDTRPSAVSASDHLTLNLFADVCLTARRERATDLAGGRVQWEGRVPGASPGTVTLIIGDGLIVGTLRIDRDVFQIRSLGDGVHGIIDVDPAGFGRD